MGNTIRREPVNFSIPASPDYKFLNITNFRGLDVSSNPFELATNTASDCLNVYVDETNTLTTRPRLEKKELKDGSGKDILPLTGRCVGIYPLHDGYLFHWSHKMKILHGDKLTDVFVETMPLTPCKCFEQGDKIYLLGEGRYMVIDETSNLGVLKDVEGYVPNRSVIRLDGTVEKDEPLNILTNKYTEKFLWDGISSFDYDADEIEDKSYVLQNVTEFLTPESVVKQVYEDNTALVLKNNIVYLIDYSEDNLIENNTGCAILSKHTNATIFPAKDKKAFWFVYLNDNTYHRIGKYYYLEDATEEWMSDDELDLGENVARFATDDTGTNVFTLSAASGTSSQLITRRSKNNYLTTNIAHYETSSSGKTIKLSMTNDRRDNVVLLVFTQQDAFSTIKIHKYNAANKSFDYYTTNLGTLTSCGMTRYGDVVYLTGQDKDSLKPVIIQAQTNDMLMTTLDFVHVNDSFKISDTLTYAWYSDKALTTLYDNTLNLHIFPNYSTTTAQSVLPKNNFYGQTLLFEPKKYIVVQPTTNQNGEIWVWKETTDYNLLLHKHTTIDEKKNILLSANLCTRFDNNYWFASGNTYFRSQNNDPTYFPITEYSELGDSTEDITGFNIANDTTLLAYKPSRLYLIQPFYSETTGMTEYSKTESKNTVGNTATDAPIITTLTETPIQINYDGIYGLSQVSNVSAVERIADLMSEPINDRWLNEDDEVIKNAQTLNRLYWTYIILPYTKESKVDPRDVCKIYLLDNRTNSWYYWELPIKLLNAFAKDNHAEFVDTDGNIYYLTTTDIRNMGFDTQLVTEYYDYGKKLIPWHWQSQVMYLGTMNHAKRLVNTTFILTDTDTQDGYGLQYSFKVFRKLASSVPEKELSGDLNLVRSTTKKTNISKFGFLQLKLSNITEDSQGTEAEKAYRNNKLRLVGLGLKYVLLEGLIR